MLEVDLLITSISKENKANDSKKKIVATES